jgi:hypothetical protein
MKLKRMLSRLLLATTMCLCAASGAIADTPQKGAASDKTLFVKPVVLAGMLGDAQIRATLHAKAEYECGIEGEYFVPGRSQSILLAGEIEGNMVFLEESENGVDVSGQWDGDLVDETIAGEWQSADGKIRKPFQLKIVRVDDKPKPASHAVQNK